MEQVTLRTHALRARTNISAHAWTACSQVNAFTLNVFSLRRRLRERKEEVLTVAGVCVPYGEEETSSVWPPPRQEGRHPLADHAVGLRLAGLCLLAAPSSALHRRSQARRRSEGWPALPARSRVPCQALALTQRRQPRQACPTAVARPQQRRHPSAETRLAGGAPSPPAAAAPGAPLPWTSLSGVVMLRCPQQLQSRSLPLELLAPLAC